MVLWLCGSGIVEDVPYLYILNRDAQSFLGFDNGHFHQFLSLFRAPDKLLAHIGLMEQVQMAHNWVVLCHADFCIY